MNLHKKICTLLTGCFLLFAGIGNGQVQAAEEEPNILQQLLEAAQKNDDQLLIAKAQFDAAKGETVERLGPLLPQLLFSYQLSDTDSECIGCAAGTNVPESSATVKRLDFSQSIYEQSKINSYTATKARAVSAGYQYALAQYNLFERLLDQYLNILAEADNLRTLEAQRERLSKQLAIVRAGVLAGSRSPVDLTEIEANARLTNSQYVLSKIALRSFYTGLSEALKLKLKNLPPIRKDLQLHPLPTYSTDHWLDVAVEKSFSVQAANALLKAAREDVKSTGSRFGPSINVFAAHTETDTDSSGSNKEQTQTEVGIRFNLPLTRGGETVGSLRAAKARRRQADSQHNLALVEVKTLVPAVVLRLEEAPRLVNATRQALIAREAVVRQTELRYRNGAADITDLLLSYERVAEAERSYYASLYSYIRDYAEFYVRTGQLDEATLKRFYNIADFTDYDPDKALYE